MKTTVDTTCEHCGKIFQIAPCRLKYGRGKYCSRECKYDAVASAPKRTYDYICKRCGKTFTTTKRRDSTYCSKGCAFPRLTFTCQHCGKSFRSSPSANPRFCSKSCADHSDRKSEMSRQYALAFWADPEIRARYMAGIAERSESPDWYNASHFQKGEAHPRYKGNKREREIETSRYHYKLWRKSVFARDNYTCQECGERGRLLVAHHRKHWAEAPELRYDVSNGITLCATCHGKLHHKSPRTHLCPCCGERFILKSTRQRYCSHHCAGKAVHRSGVSFSA